MKEPCIAETSLEDDYGCAIVAGQCHIIRNFPEKSRSNSNGHCCKVDSKTSYFYYEGILYPVAQFTEKKNSEYSAIITLLSIWKYHPCPLFNFILFFSSLVLLIFSSILL